MKNKYIIFLAALIISLGVSAREIVVREFIYSGAQPVYKPLIVDSTNVNNKAFAEKELLTSSFSFDHLLASGNRVTADLSGQLVLASGSSDYSLHLLSFYLEGTSYQEGSLKLEAPEMKEVYVDNMLQKPADGKIKLTLEPRRHEVVIKYLAKAHQSDTLKAVIELPTGEDWMAGTGIGNRPYVLDDVTDGKRIQTASVSPNGKYVLVKYLEAFPGGDKKESAQVIDRISGAVVLYCDADSRQAQWMPVSNQLYYARKGQQGRELVTLDPVSKQEKIIGRNLPEGSFRVAPTEDYLLFTVQEKGPAEREDIRQVLVPDDRQPGWRNRMFIHKYDLNTGLYQRLTYGHTSTYINDISADGRYVLISSREPFLTERPFSRTTLYSLDLSTMQTDTILKAAKFVNRAQFSPNGAQLLIAGSGDAFESIGLNIKEGQTSNTSDGQLFLYTLADKKMTPLTKDFNPSVDRAVWNAYDKMIYVQAKDKDCVKVYRFDPAKRTIKTLPIPEDVISEFHCAANAPELVCFGMSASNSHRLYGYNLKKEVANCLVDLSADILKDVRLGEVTDWNFISVAGDTIYGRYYLPAGFDPAKKYPLIVNYYGGTTPTARVLESRYPSHAYAALGYVVYIVQPSGATGFGQEFSARHVNAWGKQTADEIIEGTIKFCEEHSFINKEKIGCMGASYGGFMTMYLQTKTDIFAAAMSHAGISDITSYWGEGYWGYSYSALATADSYPWNARDIYVDQSPLFHADKINTPILFLHGFADTNVPVGESIQMFTALKLLGKETALVEVPGQDHHILDYNKRIRWSNTIYAWFAKWLKDQPEWWDALYAPKSL